MELKWTSDGDAVSRDVAKDMIIDGYPLMVSVVNPVLKGLGVCVMEHAGRFFVDIVNTASREYCPEYNYTDDNIGDVVNMCMHVAESAANELQKGRDCELLFTVMFGIDWDYYESFEVNNA